MEGRREGSRERGTELGRKGDRGRVDGWEGGRKKPLAAHRSSPPVVEVSVLVAREGELCSFLVAHLAHGREGGGERETQVTSLHDPSILRCTGPSTYSSFRPSVHPPTQPPTHPSVRQSVRQSVRPSVHPSIHPPRTESINHLRCCCSATSMLAAVRQQ